MKKIIKNQKGFTLIEMMIVLLVISVLLMITIPNVTKHNASINEKGCEAFINMVQAQVQAFEIEHKRLPTTIDELVTEGFLRSGETTCSDGTALTISSTGEVTAVIAP